MEFALTEEQQQLVDTVRTLLTRRADPRAVRAAVAAPHGHDPELWRVLVEQVGVSALAVPEEHDGAGFSLFESLLVLEEVGRSLAPSPLLSSLVTAEALLAGADDDGRARLLPRLAAGEVAAFVDGPGRPVLDGDTATVLVAVTEAGLVEVEPASVARRHVGTVDQTLRLASVDLDGATTTPLGDPGAASAARERAALVASAGVAALATGLAARGLEMTVAYSKQRVQFGRPIGSFQALKHRMADLLVLVEMSRSASWAASYAVSAGRADAAELVHVAASYCPEAAFSVAAETVQLHGGIAITWEHDAHLVLKRAHALGQLAGQPHEHRALIEL